MTSDPRKADIVLDSVIAQAAEIDPGLIDRLASCHPALKRLKAPGLGRVLAGLITLKDAARMAGLDPQELLAHARGERAAMPQAATVGLAEQGPDWASHEPVLRLDVRPIIAQGGDPFAEIMEATKSIALGQILDIAAPFDPVPLRRVLGGRGFASHAARDNAGHWRVLFRREADDADSSPPVHPGACDAAEIAPPASDDGALLLDVRGLAPPEPMLAVLRALDAPGPNRRILVRLDREPVHLFPELAERGWRWRALAAEPGEFRLEITQDP
jgi:uncharacterized protein (DUF2249 family)